MVRKPTADVAPPGAVVVDAETEAPHPAGLSPTKIVEGEVVKVTPVEPVEPQAKSKSKSKAKAAKKPRAPKPKAPKAAAKTVEGEVVSAEETDAEPDDTPAALDEPQEPAPADLEDVVAGNLPIRSPLLRQRSPRHQQPRPALGVHSQ